MRKGLIPQKGILSERLGENKDLVYLFPSEEHLDNALLNWLGEEYEELAEERGIEEIDLSTLLFIKKTNKAAKDLKVGGKIR